MSIMILNKELYRNIYLIRAAENAIMKYYFEDEMKTPMHMSMGSEAIAVGVCDALSKRGHVFGTYRSHALYLAKTRDVDGFFYEMYGRKLGCAKGKSGSMHLSSPQCGHFGSSAVVASNIAPAVGCAFANKYKRNDNIVATFFGDAGVDEGCFWESLNIACLMRLPVIFVCEDNDLAVHTSNNDRRGFDSLDRIVDQFNCNVLEADGQDVLSVYNATQRAISLMDHNKKPTFMHLCYYRPLEHVGVGTDFDAGYRHPDPTWTKTDPIVIQRNRVLSLGAFEDDVVSLEKNIDNKTKESIAKSKSADFADGNELFKDVFYENP